MLLNLGPQEFVTIMAGHQSFVASNNGQGKLILVGSIHPVTPDQHRVFVVETRPEDVMDAAPEKVV